MKTKIFFSSLVKRSALVTTALVALLLLAGCATPVGEVESWGVTAQEESAFTGEVVDVMCELTGNCATNCGEGSRQLALKTADQGTVLVAKNITLYSGAAEELWPYCGQEIEVNGLFTENQNVRFFQVQNVRTPGGKWQRADRFHKAWAARSGKSAGKARSWYKNDDRVDKILQRDGRLGLGPAADTEFFK
ncbi:MAG: hypothetical protein KTR18_16345 [Acidiferrobacterales bacterium]|nr:hypothetical protein [Acidiferrobacterales bacterium]